MKCEEAAEFVSRLCDGLVIPREVAEHIGTCQVCRTHLSVYLGIGAELRRLASLEQPVILKPRSWDTHEKVRLPWWHKGSETMKIPRFAFALMLIAIFALSGGLALVKARPGGNGSVLSLEFKVRPGDRGPVCSTETDHEGDVCSFGMSSLPGHVWGSVRFLRREGVRVKLLIKAVYHAPTTEHEHDGETADAALRNISPVEYWLEPDNPLRVPVEGLGNLLVYGEFRTREPVAPRWFQYKILGRDGEMIVNSTATTNPNGNTYYDAEAEMPYADGAIYFHVRVVGQFGETEKIGARTLWIPGGERAPDAFEQMRNMPEREFLCTPGESLKIPVEGYGDLEIQGHFESALPDDVRMGLYPEDGRLRISPPVVLVREKEMLMKGDMGGGQVRMDKSYFAYGDKDEGWYLFSANPFAGAVEGTLTMNQIEFSLERKRYFLFTGDPIIFGNTKVWVKHYASIRDADPTSPGDGWQGNEPRLAFGQLQNLAVGK